MTMLPFSVLWVTLAAAITLMAMIRRSANSPADHSETRVNDSGKALALLAVVSSLVLLAGFVFVGRFLVSGL
jgi:hypothetical protein